MAAEAFTEARAWLLQPGHGVKGRKRWDDLFTVRDRLRNQPYLGDVDDERPDYRRLVVSGYRIIYRISPDTGTSSTAGDILIVALLGPGQQS